MLEPDQQLSPESREFTRKEFLIGIIGVIVLGLIAVLALDRDLPARTQVCGTSIRCHAGL
jgi:hypothetical protein